MRVEKKGVAKESTSLLRRTVTSYQKYKNPLILPAVSQRQHPNLSFHLGLETLIESSDQTHPTKTSTTGSARGLPGLRHRLLRRLRLKEGPAVLGLLVAAEARGFREGGAWEASLDQAEAPQPPARKQKYGTCVHLMVAEVTILEDGFMRSRKKS